MIILRHFVLGRASLLLIGMSYTRQCLLLTHSGALDSTEQICPALALNANEMHVHDVKHAVSSLINVHQNIHT